MTISINDIEKWTREIFMQKSNYYSIYTPGDDGCVPPVNSTTKDTIVVNPPEPTPTCTTRKTAKKSESAATTKATADNTFLNNVFSILNNLRIVSKFEFWITITKNTDSTLPADVAVSDTNTSGVQPAVTVSVSNTKPESYNIYNANKKITIISSDKVNIANISDSPNQVDCSLVMEYIFNVWTTTPNKLIIQSSPSEIIIDAMPDTPQPADARAKKKQSSPPNESTPPPDQNNKIGKQLYSLYKASTSPFGIHLTFTKTGITLSGIQVSIY